LFLFPELFAFVSDLEWELDTSMDDEFRLNSDCSCPSVPAFPLELVLWSFKPRTYQTGSFAELTPKFQTCGTRSRKFRAPIPTPNDWDPCAQACATWWLTRFDWLSHNGTQSHRHKGMQARALMIL
jgi:hypothetical protein